MIARVAGATHPKVRGSEAVRGGRGGCGGGCGVGKISVDVGKQVAHDGRHTGTHVFGRQTGEVPGVEEHRQSSSKRRGVAGFF